MYFAPNSQKSIDLNTFELISDKFEGVYFGISYSQELRQWLNLNLDEKIMLYTPYEFPELVFQGDINEQ